MKIDQNRKADVLFQYECMYLKTSRLAWKNLHLRNIQVKYTNKYYTKAKLIRANSFSY